MTARDLEFTAATPIVMPTDRAGRVALILNELAMNACKHASRREGTVRVWVTLMPKEPGRLNLTIRDNGEGLPRSIDVAIRGRWGYVS